MVGGNAVGVAGMGGEAIIVGVNEGIAVGELAGREDEVGCGVGMVEEQAVRRMEKTSRNIFIRFTNFL